jgi:Ran GTPase-activating protein (RanGAP) involved in mRNA processing and transport
MLVAKGESQLALAIDSTVLVSVLDLGGKTLCSVETKRTTTIGEVKQLIQCHTGLEAELSKLQLLDSDRHLRNGDTLGSLDLPRDVQFYILTDTRLIVAERAQIKPQEVTNEILAELCNAEQPGVLSLADCRKIADISCLVQQSQVRVLILSGCAGISGEQVSACIIAMGGLEILDVSSCRFGEKGAKHIANTLQSSDTRALISLNLRKNGLGVEGAKIIAAVLPGCTALTQLDVSSNTLVGKTWNSINSAYDYESSGIQALADALPKCQALSSLNLADDNLGALFPPEGWIVDDDDGIFYGPNDEEQEDPPPGSSPAGIIAVFNAIKDMRALSVLNLASNNLGALVLPEGWTKNYGEVDGKYGNVFTHADGTKQMEHPGKPEGIIALANAIPNMGAMTSLNLASNSLGVEGAKIIAAFLPKCTALMSLNMSKNGIKGAEAGKALGDALAGNTVLKELDLSGEYCYPNMDIGFVKAFTPGLSDNVALTSLNLSSNYLTGDDGDDMSGVTALANAIPDMGALTALNLAENSIGANTVGWVIQPGHVPEQRYKHSDGRMRGRLPEGEQLGKPEGVIAVANAIKDMGALSTFTFSGDYSSSKPVTMETTMTEADFSGKALGVSGGMMVAAFLPKCQALIKLDISSNYIHDYIGGEQEGDLQRICVASGIELAK